MLALGIFKVYANSKFTGYVIQRRVGAGIES